VVFFAIMLDAWSRRVVGWPLAGHMRTTLGPGCAAPPRRRRRWRLWLSEVSVGRRLEESDQLTDGVVAVLRVAEWEFAVHFVLVAASDAGLGQVAGLLQLADDLPDGSFGDADGGCDVPQASPRVVRDAREHVRVVGDEPPPVIVRSRT
jgi:hypothetical protein